MESESKSRSKKSYPPLNLAAPVIFMIVFVSTFLYSRFEPTVEDVDAEFVKTHKDLPGYVLIDARSKELYSGISPRYGIPGGHIEGSINFPLQDLQNKAPVEALVEAGITKDKILIIYCNTGVLSGRFADQLVRRLGYSAQNLRNYRGSIIDWIKYKNKLFPEDHETGFERSHD